MGWRFRGRWVVRARCVVGGRGGRPAVDMLIPIPIPIPAPRSSPPRLRLFCTPPPLIGRPPCHTRTHARASPSVRRPPPPVRSSASCSPCMHPTTKNVLDPPIIHLLLCMYPICLTSLLYPSYPSRLYAVTSSRLPTLVTVFTHIPLLTLIFVLCLLTPLYVLSVYNV
ncbi:hypothetical protein B0H17DRAFT_1085933 [Mycena rosella]|uniref:Uncharacterized protein n=1 Tax=Mycena rosella TaxID=1033263 RepID=A0AAD7CYL9_MYCRO|nr:hypothetical protein B0H17DRAFT_1085933 [Mycena rosella]